MNTRSRQPLVPRSLALRLAVACGCVLLFGVGTASAATFANPTDILINLAGGPPGVSPYPSPISVSGLAGSITKVTVTFTNLTHSNPDDLDILLLGPGGERVLLMSDAGDANAISSVRLTFSDDASAVLPDAGRIVSGTYRPTNYAPAETNFPAGTPGPPYSPNLSVFDGTNPNGTWRLFVHDDTSANGSGIITGGWLLTLGVAALPPVIVDQPLDQIVEVGGDATFQVGVSGTPPFGYQWFHNGSVIVPFDQGGPTLTLANVKATDAGFYSVLVTNAANPNGVRSDDAHLNVVGPLAIVSQPQDQTVVPGSTVTFEVGVTGAPPFGYQWYRNGQVFVPFDQGGPTLTIANVGLNLAGYYFVVVTNAGTPNGVRSANALLNVLGPLTIVQPPSSVTALPGATVELCVAAAGRPPIRYQWTLNGQVLSNQTDNCLVLRNVDAKSGGNFQVIVYNGEEAVTTQPALVVVRADTAGPSPTDKFDDRPTLQGPQGILQGDNSRAGREPEEPELRGGGRSVWFQWFAPDSGIVTVGARGSSFDTLLGVYTGTKVNQLTPVTKDDDRGGFYTSSLQFNAERGKLYQIQLDGFGLDGAGGPFTVCWALEPTQELIPIILEEPVSVGVRPGGTAVFRVLTDGQPVQYQWFFNGNPIAGATDNVLAVPNARSAHVGLYRVRLLNQFRRVLFSEAAELQLGSFNSPVSQDKLENVYFALANRSPGGGGFTAAASGSLGAGYMAIGLGNLVSNEFASVANHQPFDPNPCGGAFLGTKWQGLFATNTGLVQVHTLGSEIPVRLAIYHLTGGLSDLTVPPIVCDLTSASNGLPVIVQFDAQQGSNYLVEVEGFQASGNIELNCLMGTAPPLTNPLRYCFVSAGGSIQLSMPATNWFPLPACQWRFNGVNMEGETGQSLLVKEFSLSKVGTYSVWMSNFVGTATRDVAYLALAGPFILNHWWTTNGSDVGFVINASNSTPFVLETSIDLNGAWLPIATNPDPCLILLYTNSGALTEPQRFFRAAPWPPIGP